MQVRLRQILGAITSEGLRCEGRPENNSTRWVFDVEIGLSREDEPAPIPVTLLLRGEPARVRLFSFTLGAMSANFYSAGVHLRESSEPARHFDILYKLPDFGAMNRALLQFRVSVDVMHSMYR